MHIKDVEDPVSIESDPIASDFFPQPDEILVSEE